MLELMINEEVIQVEGVRPDTMLLSFLREQQGLTGTKEGCASGDCGACTVVMVDLDPEGELRHQQINACITPVNALHGKQIITVEHLKQGGVLHPIQKIIAEKHGTQCGFCTPGFVMSLYTLSRQKTRPQNPAHFLGGNLCRCTGYGPLLEAAEEIAGIEYWDPAMGNEQQLQSWINDIVPQKTPNYAKPKTREELAEARAAMPDARLIAGGTDLALEITQQLNEIDQFIDISEVDYLLEINQTTTGWRIGSAVPVCRIHALMRRYFPSTDETLERLGSLTIRNRATLGGSLAHASPIGDIAPLLISLNARVEVDDGKTKKLYNPEDYITGYRETKLKPEQWISAVHIPRLAPNQKHAIYKISKRYEDDISTVVLAINLTMEADGRIKHSIISAGGVAAKSVRLSELEKMMVGRKFTQPLVNTLKGHVPKVICPLSDVRGSAEYRVRLVQNLLQRFYLECNGINTRLVEYV